VVTGSTTATFGKTTVGASANQFVAERKRVNRYALTSPGSVTKLSVYLAPGTASGTQPLKGVIYADSSGTPGALVATSEPMTYSSTQPAGWYDLVFAAPVKLAAGNYWIGELSKASSGVAGYRYDVVTGARDFNNDSYATGPSNPFGAVSVDTQQMSLYATYTPG
jgi:hypothetical protein